jgi:hypothetical protein
LVQNTDRCCSTHFSAENSQNRPKRITISPGIDVMILKIFLPKHLAKKLEFLTENKANFLKK